MPDPEKTGQSVVDNIVRAKGHGFTRNAGSFKSRILLTILVASVAHKNLKRIRHAPFHTFFF